jgi:hypothetical protein
MTEAFQTAAAVLIMIVFFVAARRIAARRYLQAAAGVIDDLKQQEAWDENRAVDLPYAQPAWYRLGLRDYRRKSLEGLVAHRLIGVTPQGRYYLQDPERAARLEESVPGSDRSDRG